MKHRGRKDWYFVHLLAAFTAATTVIMFWLQATVDLTAVKPEIPLSVALVTLIGTVAMLWFWIRMMAANIRKRVEKHAAAWGWFMILGFMFGALAYFIAVWRPAHRPN